MFWHDGRLVAFDLETTSAEPTEARIVSAAIAVCGGDEPTETRTWLVDPGVEIPDEAAAVHGITTERARAEGQPISDVMIELVSALTGYRRLGEPLVVFNARYDLTVMDREARRLGLNGFPWVPPLYVIDPLVTDKWLDRYRKGSRKLDAICAHYGAKLDSAHDADSDALAAARLAWALGKRGRVIRRVRNGYDARELRELEAVWDRVRHDLPALHQAQVGWAHEQAVGLAQHFREQGNPDADRVQTEWPVVPERESAAA